MFSLREVPGQARSSILGLPCGDFEGPGSDRVVSLRMMHTQVGDPQQRVDTRTDGGCLNGTQSLG